MWSDKFHSNITFEGTIHPLKWHKLIREMVTRKPHDWSSSQTADHTFQWFFSFLHRSQALPPARADYGASTKISTTQPFTLPTTLARGMYDMGWQVWLQAVWEDFWNINSFVNNRLTKQVLTAASKAAC